MEPLPPPEPKVKKKYHHTSVDVQKAIILDRSAGLADHQCAKKYGVSVATVNRCWSRFAKSAKAERHLAEEPIGVFHSRIRRKAIDAVESGLDHKADPYKRADVGVKVMKGIGEFDNDKTVINNFNIVAQTPAHLRERYLSNDDQEEAS